jgi:hypothetical protein
MFHSAEASGKTFTPGQHRVLCDSASQIRPALNRVVQC